MTEEQCIQELSTTAQPGSTMAIGITARVQQLQLAKLSDRTGQLSSEVARLVAIAEQQRILAAKLDGQTDTLIGLTRWLRWLTIWLVVLTVVLCGFETYHFFESRHAAKVGAVQNAEPAGGANGDQPIR